MEALFVVVVDDDDMLLVVVVRSGDVMLIDSGVLSCNILLLPWQSKAFLSSLFSFMKHDS